MTAGTAFRLRWLLGAAAAGLFGWAVTASRFRIPDHGLRAEVGVPIAAALGVTLIASTLGTRWRSTGWWLALALAGQGAALQLIEAGQPVRYQHYRSLTWVAEDAPGLVRLILLVQVLAVCWGLRGRLYPIAVWLRRDLGGWRLALLGTTFVATSATLSRSPGGYLAELGLASALQLLALANLVLAAWTLPTAGLAGRLHAWLEAPEVASDGGRRDWVPWLAGLWVFALSALLCVVSYGRSPHIPDEVVYLIHAKQFAAGRLLLPMPPVLEGFQSDLIYYASDRVFTCFPPGWPAALALGVLAGAPWLVNPVLAGLNVVGTYQLMRGLSGTRHARLAVLLMAASPWYVFLAMSFMAHTFTLSAVLVAALALTRARSASGTGGGMVWGLVAGLALGVVSLIRPLDAVVVAIALGLWALGLAGSRLRLPALLTFGIGTAAGGLANFWYNATLTGSARLFPVMAYFDKYYGKGINAMGFGPDRGLNWQGLHPMEGHGLLSVLLNTNFNLFSINVELFGWATGSLLLTLIAFLWGPWRTVERAYLLVIAMVVALHSLYWFSGGPDFGARYWYLVLLPCLGLTIRGAEVLTKRLSSAGVRDAGGRVLLAMGGLAAMAALTFFPWRAIDKYHDYRRMPSASREVASDPALGHSLVLIRGKRFPDYMALAAYNPLTFSGPGPIFAFDRDSVTRARLLAAFPYRPVVVLEGPTVTGDGYHLAGPDSTFQAIVK